MEHQAPLAEMALDYRSHVVGRSRILHADCFEWFRRIPENSLHAIVTDPPYGVKEYDLDQLAKLRLVDRLAGKVMLSELGQLRLAQSQEEQFLSIIRAARDHQPGLRLS